jgi:membrane-bound ClpP family serine protease
VDDETDAKSLKQARWRVGLASLLLFLAGLVLLVAHVLDPVGGVVAIVGCVGLNLVRVAR